MATQTSTRSSKGTNTENKNAAKQQVNNTSNSPKRVVVTRNEYDVVYDHAVSLVVAYSRGQQVEKPREGFAFGPIANGNHTRGYAKSLIWGFATSKAGKVLTDLDKAEREKIAIAILTDCNLVKGDSKAIAASLAKVEPKRERVFAEAVLSGLKASETKTKTTRKGGNTKGESKSKTKPATRKSSKPKTETKAAPKGGKGKTNKPATK